MYFYYNHHNHEGWSSDFDIHIDFHSHSGGFNNIGWDRVFRWRF